MNDQTERTSCAVGAAPLGMPPRHPLARLGLVLATLMLIDTAFGQADNIDPAEALSPDTSPALDQPALPAETSVAEAEPDSEEGAGGGEPLSPDYGLTEEQVAAYQPPHDPADDYFDAIDRIEGDLGPYATELSDLYLGLGQALIKNGDFEQARDAFHRGVMVERVNSGPNSPEQTNHLFQLANIELLLGEWDEADEILQNIYFVNTNYYGDTSAEVLPVLDRIYTWYMLTRPPGSPELDYYNYERIIEITEEAARVSEAVNGKGHHDTALAYRRAGDSQFQMVRHLTGAAMMMPPEMYVATTSGGISPLGFGAETVVKHYNSGRKAYLHFLESLATTESTTPLEYAEALADLGDWFMVFEKPRKSRSLYEQGYKILVENDVDPAVIESYMSRPQPMHFIYHRLPDLIGESPEGFSEINLEFSLTVTSYGQVRNVELLNAPDGLEEDALQEITKQVQLTPFRPALKQGEVVTTREFIWRYQIVPDWAAS
ncbi:MAG: tetratricopeptide repeat protein [Xanthomonadales bacterium]|nr:tetratricopeptide repeat protein [Xanthomonadales bacterium]